MVKADTEEGASSFDNESIASIIARWDEGREEENRPEMKGKVCWCQSFYLP